MKQQILAQIADRLSALGISARYGTGTDISIAENFFDANWGTGSKKIDYEASVFLDEQKQTAFMYEKTTETGRGLSFGSDEETSFQSGKTLFRKVKGVRCGPDGRSVEYNLDLGAIPSAVKETAKQFGWSFKTVLKKEKAMYPAGYMPAAAPAVAAPAVAAPAAAVPAAAVPAAVPAPEASYVPIVSPSADVSSADVSSADGGKRAFCTNCGAPLAPGAAFCTVCGRPVKSVPETGVPVVSTGVPDGRAGGYAAPAASYHTPAPAYGQAAPGASVPKKRRGTWQLIAMGVLAVLFAAVYALAGVGFLGWMFFLIVIAADVFLFFRLRGGKVVAGIALLAVSAVVLFLGLAFAAGPSGDHPEQTGGIPTQDIPDAVQEPAAEITFSKTYPLDNGGSLLAEIVTTDLGKYEVTLTLTVPNTILPEDFLLSGEGGYFEYEGATLQEMEFIEAFLCDTEGATFYSNSSLGPAYTENGLAEESSTFLALTGHTAEELRAFAETYDEINVFRYRASEVGIRDLQATEVNGYTSYTYGYNSERAFNLHPSLLEVVIPWDDIFAESGIA